MSRYGSIFGPFPTIYFQARSLARGRFTIDGIKRDRTETFRGSLTALKSR